MLNAVIPAKAGIQVGWWCSRAVDSRFRGNDEWGMRDFMCKAAWGHEGLGWLRRH